ncbi:MAG: CopG family transcriptional regulator [Propioniciclava sp.]
MQRTNIFLEERQTRALDRLARSEGVSRAEVIRRLLDRGLAGAADAEAADLAALDLSFGCLADVAVDLPSRGGDPREGYLTGVWEQP